MFWQKLVFFGPAVCSLSSLSCGRFLGTSFDSVVLEDVVAGLISKLSSKR